MKNPQILSALAGMLLLWIAVGFVLFYDHASEQDNPGLTHAQRQSHAEGLYAIAAVFLLFNGAMTVLRLRMAKRAVSRERLLEK